MVVRAVTTPTFDPGAVPSNDADLPPTGPAADTQSDGKAPPADTESNAARPAAGRFLPRSNAKPRAKKPADKAPSTKPPRARKNSEQLKSSVAEMYMSVGMMVVPFDPQCGMVVCNSAESCADSLVKAAEENDAMMRTLQAMVATSAWGGVIAAHLPIIMAVMAHHVAPDKLPPGMGGGDNVVPFTKSEEK